MIQLPGKIVQKIPKILVKIRSLVLILALAWGSISPSWAELSLKEGTILFDSEIHQFVESWIRKIFKVASIPPDFKVYLLINNEVNAAALPGKEMLIYSELIIRCENLSQFLGVIAHEVGHIAGHHHERIMLQSSAAQIPMWAGILLGAATALLGGGGSGMEAGLAGMAAGLQVSNRSFLTHMRTEEASADAAAFRYCQQLGIPCSGLVAFFNYLGNRYGYGGNVYLATHPDVADRAQKLEIQAKIYPYKSRLTPQDEEKFQRIRAKLIGLLKEEGARILGVQNQFIYEYQKVFSTYRRGQYSQALALAQKLSPAQEDPFLSEISAELQMKLGHRNEAFSLYRSARKKLKSDWLDLGYVQNLLDSKNPKDHQEALSILKPIAHKSSSFLPIVWLLKSRAHALLNQPDWASLCAAEYALRQGDVKMVSVHAKRATKSKNLEISRQAQSILAELKDDMKERDK